jgi:phosphopantetheinyl transferase
MASVTEGGVVLVDERWRDPASRELMAYRFLNANEREAYRRLKPLAQRHWLLGRIAAKDAVRHALLLAGHDEVFPAEITIANDDRGRPYVAQAPGAGAALDLSISHTSWVGAALVGPRDRGVGVDVEAVEPRAAQLTTVLTPAELALLPEDDRGLTRAWAAKEAAAKAAGTGLAGRPRDFPIRAVVDDRLLVGDRWIDTRVTRAPVQAVPGAATGPLDDDPAPPATAGAADDQKEFVIAWTDPHQ